MFAAPAPVPVETIVPSALIPLLLLPVDKVLPLPTIAISPSLDVMLAFVNTPSLKLVPAPAVPVIVIFAASVPVPVEAIVPCKLTPRLLISVDTVLPVPSIVISPSTEAIEVLNEVATPWLEKVPAPPVPVRAIWAAPVEAIVPETLIPLLVFPVEEALPVPIMLISPSTDVIVADVLTPSLALVPAPPVPVRVIFAALVPTP